MTRAEKIAKIKEMQAQKQSVQPSQMTREQKIARIKEMQASKSQPMKAQAGAAPEPESGGFWSDLGDSALETLGEVGQFIDTYTGAPTRAAVRAAQKGENPLPAFGSQFGEDPSLAPTGKEIAQAAGVPDTSLSQVAPGLFTDDEKEAEKLFKFKRGGAADITASGAAGLGLDIAADPATFLTGAGIAKTATRGGKIAKGAKAAASQAGQVGAKVGAKAVQKGGAALTGVPEEVVRTYMNKTKKINKIIGETGGDITVAADDFRQGLQDALRQTKSKYNKALGNAIDKAPANSFSSSKPIEDAILKVRKTLDPALEADSIKEVDELIDMIKTKGGKVNAKDANKIKRIFQDYGKRTYAKDGKMFASSSEAAERAAKEAASEARKIESKLAPGAAKANAKLSELRNYEKNINKNLIAPGKPDASITAAGSGANRRNLEALQKAEDLTGYRAVEGAEDLAAAKVFGNTPILPMDATGKSATRVAAGYLLGGPAGAAMTSPLALKAAINAGDISVDLVRKLSGKAGRITDDMIDLAVNTAQTREGQNIIRGFYQSGKLKGTAEVNKVAEEKKKGPGKWAEDGFKKLLDSTNDARLLDKYKDKKSDILKSAKLRKMLIRASDLKPGSKEFKRIERRIASEIK